MSSGYDFSLTEARRIALGAQGFNRPRPAGPVTADDISRTIRQLGLLQLDFVNVLGPSHYQVLFSRLGPYERSRLHEAIYKRREFTEHWAHEASVVPMETWPLLRYRRESHRVQPYGFESFLSRHPEYVAWVVEQVRERGPLTAEDLPAPDGASRRLPESWFGTVPRAVLEAHFGSGVLAIAERRPDFSRVYDLSERVIPPCYYSQRAGIHDSQRELLLRAARSHGIGTAGDLADYYRMPVKTAQLRIDELVSSGQLLAVRVEGWRSSAYICPETQAPRRIEAAALLSPFDPVVWRRDRAVRLFDFEHRFEIFVPKEKRRWGCYVLPFLLDDRLAARVDLKADREKRRLLVQAGFLEPHAESARVADALASELRMLASWLSLDSVAVKRRGELARHLALSFKRLF